uniref:Protein FAM221A n=1 Tax=Electrophorus electricus TaxID=8005 RepID=A0A4W4EYB7_ELEEL
MERIHIGKTAAEAVNAYLEYKRIVGEDDGGRLFTQAQYEEYKQSVVPSRLLNRLYVSFGVPGRIDCKHIGPETPCFCSHRYLISRWLPKTRPKWLRSHRFSCPYHIQTQTWDIYIGAARDSRNYDLGFLMQFI